MTLNKRVAKLQAEMDTRLGNDLDSKLDAIRSSQASASVETDQLKGSIENLSGRVEDNEHIIKRTVERDLSDQDAMRANLSDLTKKIEFMEMSIERHRQYLGLEALTIAASPLSEKPGIEGEVPASPQKAATPDPKASELESYEASLTDFKDQKFERAMGGFKSFLKQYPKSDRADNAQFWIGECYMSLRQYEQAI
ncbi:tetratricopeptide repeat protein, partial [Thermodesulfobacteriota bacterium]